MKHALVILGSSRPNIADAVTQFSRYTPACNHWTIGIADSLSATTARPGAHRDAAMDSADTPAGKDPPVSSTSAHNGRQLLAVDGVACASGAPSVEQVYKAAGGYGIDAAHFAAYACRRWGPVWYCAPIGRWQALDEILRYRNDGEGLADKIETWLARDR